MIIKQPPVYDVSHYNSLINWAQVAPRPAFGICKATEGNFFQDDTFLGNWLGFKANGIPRMAYHFHRKADSASSQAKYFCDFVGKGGVNVDDLFALDVEEGGETAKQLRAWIEAVRSTFPQNRILIYSRANILNPIQLLFHWLGLRPVEHPLNSIAMTPSDREFFKQIPVWTAGYPNNPDLYNTIPDVYKPDPTKWGPTVGWQYSEHGLVQGIPGETDLDLFTDEFLATLPGSTPPQNDITTIPFVGVKRISGIRHGWKFELFISDPIQVDYEVVCLKALETVSSVAKRKNAQIATNAGEWDRVSMPKDFTVSHGALCVPRLEAVPSLMFIGMTIAIDHVNRAGTQYALSGLRYLIQNGMIESYLDGMDAQYTEGHARSIHGLTVDGRHIVMQSEGVYPNHGLTLKQCAELLKQYGAVTAFDSGGGGDVTCVMNGESLIMPENIDPMTGLPFERPLPGAFLMYAKGENMPSDVDHYEYTATGARAIRTGPGATFPRIDPAGSNSYFNTNTIAKGGALPADRVTLDATNAALVQGAPGDVWVHLYDNNGHAVEGWTAKIHKGQPQVTEKFVPGVTPPIPTESPVMSISQSTDFASKKLTVTIVRADGTNEAKTYPIA